MTNAATALAVVLPPEQLDDAIQLFDDAQAEKFAALAVRAQEIVERIPAGVPKTAADAADIEKLMSLAKTAKAAVEDARKATVGPLNDQVKAINDLFRPLTSALDSVKAKCEPLAVAWIRAKQAEQERERLEAERLRVEAERREIDARLAADAAKTEAERKAKLSEASAAMLDQAAVTSLAPKPVKGVMNATSSHVLTVRWVAVVSKPADLPREYLMPNHAAIDEALAAAVRKMRADGRETPDFDVPGVTVTTQDGLRKGRGAY